MICFPISLPLLSFNVNPSVPLHSGHHHPLLAPHSTSIVLAFDLGLSVLWKKPFQLNDSLQLLPCLQHHAENPKCLAHLPFWPPKASLPQSPSGGIPMPYPSEVPTKARALSIPIDTPPLKSGAQRHQADNTFHPSCPEWAAPLGVFPCPTQAKSPPRPWPSPYPLTLHP